LRSKTEVLCGCVSGRFRGSGRDAGGKIRGLQFTDLFGNKGNSNRNTGIMKIGRKKWLLKV
jgi:hypothetical protein